MQNSHSTFKSFAKSLILQGIDSTGLNHLARYRTRRKLLVLCYHGVVSAKLPPNDARTLLTVTAPQFEQQMRELYQHWNPITLEQLCQTIENKQTLPDRAVLVTFDDGFRNNLTIAAPILEKYRIPATVFVTTGMIGTEGKLIWALELIERLVSWNETQFVLGDKQHTLPPPNTSERTWAVSSIRPLLRQVTAQESQQFINQVWEQTTLDLSPSWKKELYDFLTWDEVRQLKNKGIAIGAHTVTHPILSELEPTALETELKESKQRLEQELRKQALGGEIYTLAYPFGSQYDYSEAVVAKAKQLGYHVGFTLTERRNPEVLDPMQIHRICVCNDLTQNSFRAIISGIRGN